jgi:hypothetical protein
MKLTKASFKSFLKRNQGNLFIRNESHFNGMSDMVESNENPQWRKLEASTRSFGHEYHLGYEGVYLVRSSRDSFIPFAEDGYVGINVYNCCGSFTVATKSMEIK